MEGFLRATGGDVPLDVLVELGVPGHRSGARDVAAALGVARGCRRAQLRLAGVEGCEGIIASARTPDALRAVDAFLGERGRLAGAVVAEGLVHPGGPIVSAGGSKYFDRVAVVLGPLVAELGSAATLVVRAGSYVTHHHGVYEAISPLSGASEGPGLRGALELWAVGLSVPEPGLATVGFGERDASYDLDLPMPLRRLPRTARDPEPFTDAEVIALDDQHCYLRFSPARPLAVGDRLGFGPSHPLHRVRQVAEGAPRRWCRVVAGDLATAFH